MSPEERIEHQEKMHEGLASIIRLMPTTTETGAVSLLDMGMRAICVMRDDNDIPVDEAKALQAALVHAFTSAHPSLDALLKADLSILNDVIAQVLAAPHADHELVQLAKSAMREFRLRGLQVIH